MLDCEQSVFLLTDLVRTQVAQAKYEHRRASALLRNIQNITICMGKKPTVSVTYENERILKKKQLTLLKMCVTSLLCCAGINKFLEYSGTEGQSDTLTALLLS